MAALSEKILWPVVAILIFGVLTGFYIDDRRSLMQDGASEHSGQSAKNKTAEHKQASSEHAGKTASNKEHGGKAAEKSPANSSQSKQATTTNSSDASSMSMDEYLSGSADERSAELEANVSQHQGFSGSIDEYLSGKSKASKNIQANKSSKQQNQIKHNDATSMSMDEYQAKTSSQHNGSTQSVSSNSGAYHGGIDDYLTKYGDEKLATHKKQSSPPSTSKDPKGFHGSYEEYAKQFN